MRTADALAAIQVDSYRTAYADVLSQEYLDRFSYEEQADDWRALLVAPEGDLLCVAETDAKREIVGYGLAGLVRPRLRPTSAKLKIDALCGE